MSEISGASSKQSTGIGHVNQAIDAVTPQNTALVDMPQRQLAGLSSELVGAGQPVPVASAAGKDSASTKRIGHPTSGSESILYR